MSSRFDTYGSASSEKIYVRGTAKRKIPADMMEIKICFRKEDPDASKSSQTVLRQSEEFLQALKDIDFPMDNIQMDEDSFGSDRSYRNNDDLVSERIFTIRMPIDISFVNHLAMLLIDRRWDAGITTKYIASNEEELHDELMQEAIRNARMRAEKIAAAAGRKVKGLDCADTEEDDYGVYYRRAPKKL